MNPFQPFALAHVDYGKPGQAWRETNLGCSKESIVREMTSGELEGVQRVLWITATLPPEDITGEIADALMDEYPDLTESAL